MASGLYSINRHAVSSIDFASGFTAGSMVLVGKAKLNGGTGVNTADQDIPGLDLLNRRSRIACG